MSACYPKWYVLTFNVVLSYLVFCLPQVAALRRSYNLRFLHLVLCSEHLRRRVVSVNFNFEVYGLPCSNVVYLGENPTRF
jgi:hypothetical protein